MTNVITFKMNVDLFTPNWVFDPKCVLFSKLGPLTMSNSDVGYFVSNPENRWNAKVYQMKY